MPGYQSRFVQSHRVRSRKGSQKSRLTTAIAEVLEQRRLLSAGDLDPTFGTAGYTKVDTGGSQADYGYSVAIQSDGKIVVAGLTGDGSNTANDFLVTRFNTNGSLDTTFGTGGKVITDFGDTDSATSVAIQSDGKIVVGGATGSGAGEDWAIARYNSDGTLDSTFGTSGKVTLDFNGLGDTIAAIAIQPTDQKIVATGVATGATSDLATARFNTNGTLDTSFGSSGKVITDFFGGVDGAGDVEVQSDGKIIVTGGSVPSGSYRRFVLVRYTSAGALDSTFGTGGEATTDFGVSAYGKDMAIESDGKYVVGGLVGGTGTAQNFAVARYNSNGTLDTTFGTSGSTILTGFTGFTFESYGTAIQTDGKILFGGYLEDTSADTFFGLTRFNSNGSLDSTFGSGGEVTTDIPGAGSGFSQGADVALQSDGNIVMAGSVYSGASSEDLVAVRYLAGGATTGGSVSLDGSGTLSVTGTSGDDTLTMGSSGGVFSVTLNGVTTTFNSTDVHSLAVSLLGGNDTETHNGGVPGGTTDLGDGNDSLIINTGNSTSPILVVTGGAGNDSVTIGVAAFTPVSFDGGTGTDSVTFNGSQGNDVITITASSVSGAGNSLSYSNLESLDLEGNFGDDTINVSATNSLTPVTVNGGDGNDTIKVGAGVLDNVAGVLTVNGQNGTDSLLFDDSGLSYNDNYTLTSTSFNRAFFAGATFGTFESFQLLAETGPNVITVSSLPSGMSVTLTGDGGGDTCNLNTTHSSPFLFNAGSGNSILNINAGSYTFDTDAHATSTSLTVNVASGAAAFINSTQHLAALNLTASSVTLAASGSMTLYLGTLSLSATARLDMKDNDLVVNNGNFSTIQQLVFNGYRQGADPTATGIVSSTGQTAAGNPILALLNNALIGSSDYPFGSGETISANAVFGKYTYFGDTNLDGQVTADDYGALDANFGATSIDPGVAWIVGDTNFDGSITADDYGALDANFGLGVGNPLGASTVAAPSTGALQLNHDISDIVA